MRQCRHSLLAAQAALAAAEAKLEKLQNGNRRENIETARRSIDLVTIAMIRKTAIKPRRITSRRSR